MAAPASRSGYVRWLICALLFFAATINYVDRQVIGILKPTLQHEFGWSEVDYADIVFTFQLAYAIGFVIAGRVIDRVGTRLGFAAAIVLWSLAAIGHAGAPRFGPAAAQVLSLPRPRLLDVGRGLHADARAARSRRVGQLPVGDQDGRGVVSEDASARLPPASSIPAPTSARS